MVYLFFNLPDVVSTKEQKWTKTWPNRRVKSSHFVKFIYPNISLLSHKTLFELDTFFDESIIEDEVRTAIQNYEPRARVLKVNADIISDRNDIRVTVEFQVVSTLEKVTLEVSLARLR